MSGVAAAGSVAATITTYRLGARRLREDRRLGDLADARAVLSEAAVELHLAASALNVLRARIEPAPMDRSSDQEDSDALIETAAEQGKKLEMRVATVMIRFKESDAVTRSLNLSLEAMLGLVTAYRMRHRGRKDDDALVERETNVEELRNQFDTWSTTFYEAAQYAVGSVGLR